MAIVRRSAGTSRINLGALASIAEGMELKRDRDEREAERVQAARESMRQAILQKMKIQATRKAAEEQQQTARDLARIRANERVDARADDRKEWAAEQEWDREKLRITEEGRQKRQLEAIKAGQAKAGVAAEDKATTEMRKRRKVRIAEESKAVETAIKTDPGLTSSRQELDILKKRRNEIRAHVVEQESLKPTITDDAELREWAQSRKTINEQILPDLDKAIGEMEDKIYRREQGLRGYKLGPFEPSATGDVGAEEEYTPSFHVEDIDAIEQDVSNRVDEMTQPKPKLPPRLELPETEGAAITAGPKPEYSQLPAWVEKHREGQEAPIGFVEQLKKIGQNWPEYIPFSPASLYKTWEIYNAGKRLQANAYGKERKPKTEEWVISGTPPSGGGYTTGFLPEQRGVPGAVGYSRKADLDLVLDYMLEQNELRERGMSVGAMAAEGIARLPGWMIEYAATAGLARGGKTVVKSLLKRAGERGVRKAIVGLLGWTAGAAVRTTVGLPHRYLDSILKRRIPNVSANPDTGELLFTAPDENPYASILKGWGDVVIEAASEEAGATLTKGGRVLFGNTFGRFSGGKRVISSLAKVLGKRPKYVVNALNRGGWHGIISEWGEERLGTALREAFNIGNKDEGIFQRIWGGLAQDLKPKNALAEGIVLSVPGTGAFLLSRVGGKEVKTPMPTVTPTDVIEPTKTPVVQPKAEAPVEKAKEVVKAKPVVTPKAEAKPTEFMGKRIKSGTTEGVVIAETDKKLKIEVSKGFTPWVKKGPNIKIVGEPKPTPVVKAKPVAKPTKQTRKQYDETRAAAIGYAIEISQKEGIARGKVFPKDKKIWRDVRAKPGVMTHELRHAIMVEAQKDWNELRNFDFTTKEAERALSLIPDAPSDFVLGYDNLTFRNEIKDEVATRIAHGDKRLAKEFPKLAAIVNQDIAKFRPDINLRPHRGIIELAQSLGEVLSSEVLADYPELTKKATKPAPVKKVVPVTPVEPLSPFEAIQQGQKVKLRKGVTHVRVTGPEGTTRVPVSDMREVALKEGAKPYTSIELLNVPKTGKAEVLETLKPSKAVQVKIEAQIPLKPMPKKEGGFISFGRGEEKPVGVANLAKDKETRAVLDAAHGIPKTNIFVDLKDKTVDIGHSLLRTFKDLPKRVKKTIGGKTEIVDFNYAIDELRRGFDDYQIARRYGHQNVRRATQNIEESPEDLALFAETPIRDMAYEARRRMELEGSEGEDTVMPFGLKVKDVLEMEAEFNKKVGGNPKVREAIEARRAVRKEIADALIEAGILKEPQVYQIDQHGKRVGMKNEDYMQHMVFDYAEAMLRTGAHKLRKPRPGYARARKENIKAYNVALHEADLHSITRGLYDLRIAQRATRIIDHYEITDRLKNMAKQWNENNPDKLKKTWKAFLPEGYEAYQYVPGRSYYHAKTIPEQVFEEMMANSPYISEELLNKIKDGIIVGGKLREVALPTELITTVEGLSIPYVDGAIKNLAKLITSNWKEWVLINPKRLIPYNWQNLLGDFDGMIAATPRILKDLIPAVKELNKFYRGEIAADWLEEGFDRSILSSTLTQEEIPSMNLMNIIEGKAGDWNLLRRYLNKVGKYTTYRENILRVAAWKFYRDRYLAGDYSNIGISLRKDVMASPKPLDRAAKVAREAIGDYGSIAEATRELRRSFLPFASFMDVNLWRYFRAIRNIPTEAAHAYLAAREEGGDLRHSIGKAGKAAGGAGTKAAATATVAGTKALITGTKAGIGIIFLSAMMQLANQWLHPEDEALLGEYDRRRGHIALGNGKIRRGQTAFQEFLEWFGINDVISSLEDFRNGVLDTGDMAKKIAKGTPNKLIGGVNPFLKLGVESITGVRMFPEPLDRRTSSERSFAKRLISGAAQMYSALDEWKLITKVVPWIAPEPSLPYWKSWEKAFVTSFDKEEAAYNYLLSRKYKYLDKIGRGQKTLMRTEASLAYLNLKKSFRYKDETAKAFYWGKLKELGKDKEGFEKSLIWTTPLGGLKKKGNEPGSAKHFLSTLTKQEREKFLPMAREYFKATYPNIIRGGGISPTFPGGFGKSKWKKTKF